MPWITGRHAILATLNRGVRDATLYLTAEGARRDELGRIARTGGVDVRTVKAEWLRKHAGSAARGIALQLREDAQGDNTVVLRDWLGRTAPGTTGPIIALDHIVDPQNVGAILRSAHLLGTALVLIPARRSVYSGEGIARSSAGASASVPVAIVTNLSAALKECREAGWWIYAASTGGIPLPDVTFHDAAVIVLGAEGKGVSPSVMQAADVTVTIPDAAPPGSTVDSFNVSVAAGIILYEVFRARARERARRN